MIKKVAFQKFFQQQQIASDKNRIKKSENRVV